jgi:hypothetical protein
MQTFLNLLSQKCVKVDKIWFRELFFAPKLAILSSELIKYHCL